MDTTKNNPVAQLRYGSISAAIWRNDSDNGPFYNVTFQRTYKDTDQLKNTQSFGRDDLLVLAKLADLAHTKIFEFQHAMDR